MTCPGSGRTFGAGTGTPICRVCHVGWKALGLTRKPKIGKSIVPNHERRTN